MFRARESDNEDDGRRQSSLATQSWVSNPIIDSIIVLFEPISNSPNIQQHSSSISFFFGKPTRLMQQCCSAAWISRLGVTRVSSHHYCRRQTTESWKAQRLIDSQTVLDTIPKKFFVFEERHFVLMSLRMVLLSFAVCTSHDDRSKIENCPLWKLALYSKSGIRSNVAKNCATVIYRFAQVTMIVPKFWCPLCCRKYGLC